jgi:hypothetical protein
MKLPRRRAQAEVIGAIFFIVLAMIVFSLFTALTAAQYTLARQASESQLVVGYRADESLAVTLSQGSVTVRNNGPAAAVLTYYIGVNGGGQQSIVILSQPKSIAPRGTITISVSPSFQRVGVITSYGNMWWNS